jgi:two-component sensor histidine kinase
VKLTREVHHRVKNNLQVVASLINLHARGTEGDVAGAYASIQRRVDALAVVHRNHYAELEENRGVALRSIVAELTANLRATAPPSASHLTITLDMISAFITQDVAVPVAFLVTEIVELVMTCDPTGSIALSLTPGETADRAILALESRGLAESVCAQNSGRARFERIVTGLTRQLRSSLNYDPIAGRYEIAIAITPDSESAADFAKKV